MTVAADRAGTRTARYVRLSLVGLPFVIASGYLVRGVGYVLDDWFTLREVALSGAWHAVPQDQVAPRPGAALLWVLQFGAFGRHPLPSLLLMAGLVAVAASLLHRVLLLVVPAGIAHTTALLWVLLPTHTSLEAWHSCSEITLSLALGLLALLLALREGAAWRVLAVVLAVAAGLSYEAILPALGAAGLLLPVVGDVRQKVWSVAAVWLGGAGALLWSALHFRAAKQVSAGTSDLSQVLPANFSWGIAPHGVPATIVGIVTVVGLLVVLAGPWLPSIGVRSLEQRAVLAGFALLVLGALPFVRYPYGPLGAGDRENYVSSIGGCLALAVVGGVLVRRARPLAVLAVVGLALSAGWVRWERMDLWSRAGADADAAYGDVAARHLYPSVLIVFGPRPIQDENIAAFADDSNVNALVQLVLRTRAAEGRLSSGRAAFERVPAERRVDLCALSSLPHRDQCREDRPAGR